MFLFLGLFSVLVKSWGAEGCSTNSTLDAPLSPVKRNFSSPFWPQGYPMNKTCGWYITAPENHTVVLHLTFSVLRDRAEVYDVDDSKLSLVSIFTGGYKSGRQIATTYSKFHRLFVLFKSDDKTNDHEEGIFAVYTAITPAHFCSSENSLDENQNIVLKNPRGVIQTPGYPLSSAGVLIKQCYWKILAPKGKAIRVYFSSFRLYTTDCVGVVYKLNDRLSSSVKPVGCGWSPPFVVYSMANELGIKVNKPSTSTVGLTFTANYRIIPADSSGTCIPSENSTVHMAGEGMTFASSSFPLHPGSGRCNWNISVPLGNFIKLTFMSLIGSCDESFVEVYDISNFTRVPIGKFCFFNQIKNAVYSRGNNLLVTHVIVSQTPSSSYETGFLATYETVKAIPAEYACSKPTDNRILYDGEIIKLEGTHGELASYQYPLYYSNGLKCWWMIEVPAGFVVKLTFHTFELHQSQDCKADYVVATENKFSTTNSRPRKVLGKFCGSSLPGVIQSNETKLFVDFVVDNSGRYPRFHASYIAVPDPTMGPCKTPGINNVIPLTGATGRLFSPRYPQRFPNDMRCTWIITVPDGHYVKLRITSLVLGTRCDKVTLKIRDGQSSSSDLLRNFCGRTFETSLFSSGRHLWVQFHSPKDAFSVGSGFNAIFEMVSQLPAPFSCTAQNLKMKLTSETGTLASYNYPLPYDDSVECVWHINVDSDYNIELSFDFFSLPQTSDCSEDYVEVRDGRYSTSDLIGKYCGAEKPSAITSDYHDLRVAFKSSGRTKYPGFKASYETKSSTLHKLKIAGICLSVLAPVCLVVAYCLKHKSRHDEAEPRTSQGTDNVGHAAEDTRNQTTSF